MHLKSMGKINIIITILLLTIVFFVIYEHMFVLRIFMTINKSFKKDKNMANANQEDPDLIDFIKTKRIIEPSQKPYSLSYPNRKVSTFFGQTKMLNDFFKNKTGGTFIEAGAFDGESNSATLALEREFGWTGLLVEPSPDNFKALSSKNRKAKIINSCVAPSDTSQEVGFSILPDRYSSHIINASYKQKTKEIKNINIICFPLFSLMLATNLTTLDLLIIDLEGIEVKVLKALPWNKVDIKAIIVEKIWVPEGQDILRKLIEDKKYKLEATLEQDFFFSKIY